MVRTIRTGGARTECSSFTRLMNRMVRRVVAAQRFPGAPVFDALEARQLLSVTPVAMPYFQRVSHGVVPAITPALAAEVSPTQMRQAYGVNQISINGITGDGTGQTIAIVDAFKDPTLAADLATFDSMFGLAAPANLIQIRQNGTLITSTNQPPTDTSDSVGNSWAIETSLDVEWAHVMAPKASILVVLADDNGNGLYTAVTTAATYGTAGHAGTAGVAQASTVSMSWGGSDLGGTLDSLFNVPGVTFVASSGDSGAYTTSSGASYPAASPNVVGVGGTSLYLSNSSYSTESAWSGSGGGLSSVEAEPTYQVGVVPTSITTTKRALPDVSLDADPNTGVAVIDSFDMGSSTPIQVGGTSLASPMWAGILAVANQERVAAGEAVLNTTSSNATLALLYSLPSADFHDITTGSNGHAATAGYDLATGRGTPIANLLVPGLVGNVTVQPAPTIGAFTVSPATVAQGTTTTVTLTASNVTDTSAATITGVQFYLESNGTAGLQTTDTLVGAGTKGTGTSNWTYTVSTAGLAAGTYTYYAIATDSSSVTTATGTSAPTATLTITPPAVPAPAIGSVTISPAAIAQGATTTITLSANSVTDTTAATITGVQFYLESNGTAGLQTTDTLVGTGTKVTGTSNWTLTLSGATLATGTYTYYALATDSATVTSATGTAARSALLTVTPPVAPNPVIGSVSVNPTAIAQGATTTITLSANSVTDTAAATITGVQFYLESNGTAGLQTTDTLVGTATKVTGTSNWTLAISGASLAAGTYTYYALATDSATVTSAMGTAARSALLTVTAPAPGAPANDNFANATVLTGATLSVTGTNVGATRQAGEPYITGNRGGKSVWYSWTAPSTGKVTITTAGSNFDTMLGVYTGSSVTALTLVASNDDVSRNNLTSAVAFNTVAGTTYAIAVDGYNGASGNITLNIALALKPANDSFANATVITGTTASVTGSNILATREAGEPTITGNRGGASVWYTWTAAASGTVSLNTHGSNFDTMLGVFTGTTVSSLTTIASNDDDLANYTLTSALTFNATAGTTYSIAVDGYNGATGTISLNLTQTTGATQPAAPKAADPVYVGGPSPFILGFWTI